MSDQTVYRVHTGKGYAEVSGKVKAVEAVIKALEAYVELRDDFVELERRVRRLEAKGALMR